MKQTEGKHSRDAVMRFEGLPGEYLQIDWGEQRQFPFMRTGWQGRTRYFFAARLKYSRYMVVLFHDNMREETVLRSLITVFQAIGGVPWVVTTDNRKTVVLGRNEQHQPIWHPAYQKFAAEFAFHPEACAPASGNQKGAVENLVKFVQSNFLAGREFYDDDDLEREGSTWLTRVNTQRPSDATGVVPWVRLAAERERLGSLPASVADYGFFDSVVVSRESLVAIEGHRYSVPSHLLGQVLTARIHQHRVELFAGTERVAIHDRVTGGQGRRIVDPAHFEATFRYKPRARTMVYRDW